MAEAKLKTTGMHCRSCVMLIEMNVGELDGVEQVDIDLGSGIAVVRYDDRKLGVDDLVREIRSSGYEAEPLEA